MSVVIKERNTFVNAINEREYDLIKLYEAKEVLELTHVESNECISVEITMASLKVIRAKLSDIYSETYIKETFDNPFPVGFCEYPGIWYFDGYVYIEKHILKDWRKNGVRADQFSLYLDAYKYYNK